MIQPFCKRCNTELFAPSVVISIPQPKETVLVHHICDGCKTTLPDLLALGSQSPIETDILIDIPLKEKGLYQRFRLGNAHELAVAAWLSEPYVTLTTKYKELNMSKEYFKDGDMFRLFGSLVLERVPKDWPSDRSLGVGAKYYRPIEQPAVA